MRAGDAGLRELFVPYEDPIPCYVDSESTLLVGNNERSVKRSVWTIRRAVVLQEAVANRAITLIKIDESRNLADLFTKYLKFRRWRVHIDALLNAEVVGPHSTAGRRPHGGLEEVACDLEDLLRRHKEYMDFTVPHDFAAPFRIHSP